MISLFEKNGGENTGGEKSVGGKTQRRKDLARKIHAGKIPSGKKWRETDLWGKDRHVKDLAPCFKANHCFPKRTIVTEAHVGML